MKKYVHLLGPLVLVVVVFLATSALGGAAYFHFADPKGTCNSCHEMSSTHAAWSGSAHRTLHCNNCHGGALTLDAHALRSHLNRVVEHFGRAPAKPVRLSASAALTVHNACRACHPQSFADWRSGGHGVDYARIFLDPAHNRAEPPVADCLRCHGMFFDRDIQELVTDSGGGKWTLRDATQATEPAIPCLACHEIHAPADAAQPVDLHLYDRRERTYAAASELPVAKIYRGGDEVRLSSDPRQRLCEQCHAPLANHQAGTSDDRTVTGVHEGLSCLDCHQGHSNSAKASCRTCHPADSNCGIDVEAMDTTFRSRDSAHNIHRVACGDCHDGRRPLRAGTTVGDPTLRKRQ